MGKLSAVVFGDSHGYGAIVKEQGWFTTKTYTLLPGRTSRLFDKWVCLETGRGGYADGMMSRINDFYRGQYETRR
ncbi:hypothetical protein vBKpnPKlyazma_orf080 [Klebsiella phage vB_KpnP_Klyazma]|nr:hypothetical protein vBKpnPKlyazma_orf080 [Klebsiella phage vB_KpnP_Klyazma]